jgi:hypothetical protein
MRTNLTSPTISSRGSVSGPIALGASKALRHHQSAQNAISNNGDVLGYWEGF